MEHEGGVGEVAVRHEQRLAGIGGEVGRRAVVEEQPVLGRQRARPAVGERGVVGVGGSHARPVGQEAGPRSLDVVVHTSGGEGGVPRLPVVVEVVPGPWRIHARRLARGRHQCGRAHAVGMEGRTGQGEGAAHRHPQDPEQLEPQLIGQSDGVVGHQPVRRWGGRGGAVPRTVGGDQTYAEPRGRVIPARGGASGVGAPVEEQHGPALRISALAPRQGATVGQRSERHAAARWLWAVVSPAPQGRADLGPPQVGAHGCRQDEEDDADDEMAEDERQHSEECDDREERGQADTGVRHAGEGGGRSLADTHPLEGDGPVGHRDVQIGGDDGVEGLGQVLAACPLAGLHLQDVAVAADQVASPVAPGQQGGDVAELQRPAHGAGESLGDLVVDRERRHVGRPVDVAVLLARALRLDLGEPHRRDRPRQGSGLREPDQQRRVQLLDGAVDTRRVGLPQLGEELLVGHREPVAQRGVRRLERGLHPSGRRLERCQSPVDGLLDPLARHARSASSGETSTAAWPASARLGDDLGAARDHRVLVVHLDHRRPQPEGAAAVAAEPVVQRAFEDDRQEPGLVGPGDHAAERQTDLVAVDRRHRARERFGDAAEKYSPLGSGIAGPRAAGPSRTRIALAALYTRRERSISSWSVARTAPISA